MRDTTRWPCTKKPSEFILDDDGEPGEEVDPPDEDFDGNRRSKGDVPLTPEQVRSVRELVCEQTEHRWSVLWDGTSWPIREFCVFCDAVRERQAGDPSNLPASGADTLTEASAQQGVTIDTNAAANPLGCAPSIITTPGETVEGSGTQPSAFCRCAVGCDNVLSDFERDHLCGLCYRCDCMGCDPW